MRGLEIQTVNKIRFLEYSRCRTTEIKGQHVPRSEGGGAFKEKRVVHWLTSQCGWGLILDQA